MKGLIRTIIPKRNGGDKMAKLAGPGESGYTKIVKDSNAKVD